MYACLPMAQGGGTFIGGDPCSYGRHRDHGGNGMLEVVTVIWTMSY